jgi:sec-independent protein translocase protein TatA
MFGLSIWELLVVLAIVLLLFGPKRLKGLGSDLGSAIKGFRKAVAEEETKPDAPAETRVIEGEVASSARKNENKQDSHV